MYNLHGKLYEKTPEGSNDQNVFDIRVGVAILLLIKNGNKKNKKYGKLFFHELYGERDFKYDFLDKHCISNTQWEQLSIDETYFFFEKKNFSNPELYNSFIAVDEIFMQKSSGVTSGRDHFVLDKTEKGLKARFNQFMSLTLPIELIKETFQIDDGSDFDVRKVKSKFKKVEEERIKPFSHKPFDNKFIYYDSLFVDRDRKKVMKNLYLGENISLVLKKRHIDKIYNHCFCSKYMVDKNFLGGQSYVFPLWIYDEDDDLFGTGKKSNIRPEFELMLQKYYSEENLTESILFYIYAILYSNNYRKAFPELLKINYPKIPFTKDLITFNKIAEIGKTMTELHLLTSKLLSNPLVKFKGTGTNKVSNIQFKENDKQLFINITQYFSGITKEIWEWGVGKNKPMQHWIKYFKDKELGLNDTIEYCKIGTAIRLTYEEQKKVDDLYDEVLDNLIEI
ncbi:MAG: hypothetical protein APR63_10870 [Desulfuromonas sp. SDB]|nr:MAG: hypothetical protein APR63_10870 [Desulfuromonas sp. SDB]